MESRTWRSESRRSFLKRVAAAGVLVWTVPAIAFAARRPKPPRRAVAECLDQDPSTGGCTTSDDCGLGACDLAQCVPSACWCEPVDASGTIGQWICTNDCVGRCV